ncbi:hypothetical protein [Polymorphospora rubra]|uniref:Uncharacterized protein n=1 Tax=Polymorphospora rubra TaxID=338584 RepID=A0A810MS82_9ACTN|nr:hypothetical protein [Polymorphospora rubra]BCJ64067.1 hypothetical protein Prubr_10880 [Polymorphospora rubra]
MHPGSGAQRGRSDQGPEPGEVPPEHPQPGSARLLGIAVQSLVKSNSNVLCNAGGRRRIQAMIDQRLKQIVLVRLKPLDPTT